MDKPFLWKSDMIKSIDFYNEWFVNFAPKAFREVRNETIQMVEKTFESTTNLAVITAKHLIENPENLQILRMATCPPLARDRLIGIAGISPNLVKKMENIENPQLPLRMKKEELALQLERASNLIQKLLDLDILPWIKEDREASSEEIYRAATVIADRLCGAMTNPIIRNAQEERQLEKLVKIVEAKGYKLKQPGTDAFSMVEGEYAIHINVPAKLGVDQTVNISVDFAFVPFSGKKGELPILIEAKSAGDFTNVNKRRKEEAQKMQQLKKTFGEVQYILYLTGYFDTGYLGYEAAEGIDWFWEHKLIDLEKIL